MSHITLKETIEDKYSWYTIRRFAAGGTNFDKTIKTLDYKNLLDIPGTILFLAGISALRSRRRNAQPGMKDIADTIAMHDVWLNNF